MYVHRLISEIILMILVLHILSVFIAVHHVFNVYFIVMPYSICVTHACIPKPFEMYSTIHSNCWCGWTTCNLHLIKSQSISKGKSFVLVLLLLWHVHWTVSFEVWINDFWYVWLCGRRWLFVFWHFSSTH